MEASITLNLKEQKRLVVLNAVVAGQSTTAEAAASLGLSGRQVRRVLAAYRREGAATLAHGNRGRRPAHATSQAVIEQVLGLAQTTYRGCNQQHLRDLLAEREGITLSRATIHRLLASAGRLAPPAHRPPQHRPPQHRRRRERRSQEGQLGPIDGSPPAWLEARGPRLTLLAAIDDATGMLAAAVSRPQEDAHGYFRLVWQLVERYGRPLALDHDRHSIFRQSVTAGETLQDEVAGRRPPTQFGRLLEEWGGAAIAARSPQAKGRVERLFGTLQDRLVVELRLAGAATLAAANAVLAASLPRFNAQFAVPAAQPGSAYRPLEPAQALETRCCFKQARVVAADNPVTFAGQRLQLQPGATRRSYAHAWVTVHERLDGSLAVYYGGQGLPATPAPPEAPPEAPLLRARKRRSSGPPPRPPSGLRRPRWARRRQDRGPPPDRLGRSGGGPRSGPPPADHPWRRPLTPSGAARGHPH